MLAKVLYARGFAPLELASIRAWVGWLGITLVALPRLRQLAIPRRDLPFFLLYGVVGFAAFEFLYFEALERMTIAIAVALLYTAPAFVVVISRVIWRERVRRVDQGALALALTGVVLVTGALRALVTGTASVSGFAALIGLTTGIMYALYTILSKMALARYSPTTSLFWKFGFGSLFLLPLAPPLVPVMRTPDAIPLLLLLGLVPTLLAYYLYLTGLHWLRASTASILACAEPVIAALLAAVLLGEAIGGEQVTGVVLIVAAAVMLARRLDAPARAVMENP